MISTTIAQSTTTLQSSTSSYFYVHEYSLVLVNPEDKNVQGDLTASFKHPATSQDWDIWLEGWQDAGYQLQSVPQLIRIYLPRLL